MTLRKDRGSTGSLPASPARRRVIAGGLLSGLVAAGVTGTGLAQAARPRGWPRMTGFAGIDQRHLKIRQAGRDEALHVAFRTADGAPDRAGLRALNWLFRDWRDGDRGLAIDIRLFDLLAVVQVTLSLVANRPQELVLVSGYRTPRRNATLEGAAANSRHIVGQAADIRVPGLAPARVAEVAEIAGVPGLGRYPGFTHIDTGARGRRW